MISKDVSMIKYFMVDENGDEKQCRFNCFSEPVRFNGKWHCMEPDENNELVDIVKPIKNGTIEKLTGIKMNWSDEPLRVDI